MLLLDDPVDHEREGKVWDRMADLLFDQADHRVIGAQIVSCHERKAIRHSTLHHCLANGRGAAPMPTADPAEIENWGSGSQQYCESAEANFGAGRSR